MKTNLENEIRSFDGLWKGGYYEGDPLNPMTLSSYGQLNYVSVLHATYLRCIKPYVNAETVALEIGPGKGAWTKALLPAREVWALDALPEEYNGFYNYLGHPPHVKYFQVTDFSCRMLPDDYFNYMFSFGCLCHISFEGISEYAANLYPKLKRGSTCFWMVADYQKYNRAIANLDALSIWNGLGPTRRLLFPMRWLFKLIKERRRPQPIEADVSDEPVPGRWYDAGMDRTCAMLEKVGYKIIERDVETVHRDPIIHFSKA